MMQSPAGRKALLLIVGGGTMAQAIVRGAFDAQLFAPFEIVVCEPEVAKRRTLETWGVRAFSSAADALALLAPPTPPEQAAEGVAGGQILLAVKPQSLDEVAHELAPSLAGVRRVLISILAGTPTARIRQRLGDHLPVVRVMPNTAARLRKSISAVAIGPGASAADAQVAKDVFGALGEVVSIDESLMDAFTAIAGSGPAYVFYLAQAMILAATELGFDRITADRIVRQTIAGAAMLLIDSTETPEALRAQVTSKGGTTEAAIGVLEHARVQQSLVSAIAAARDRGVELAG